MSQVDENSINTTSVDLFWSELLSCINCDGLSIEGLSILHEGLTRSQESLLEMERVTGEVLAKAIHWPHTEKIQNDDVSFIGFHMANMAALKSFLKHLGNEVAESIEIKTKARNAISDLRSVFDKDSIKEGFHG